MSHSIAIQTAEYELAFRGFRFMARTATGGAAATEPIVVLGGSSQDRLSWLRYERWLLPHATVLTLELPGYGDADPLPVEYGMDFLADAVRHAAETLSLERVNVFGACFGASIALRLAQRHPDRIARLMLGGTAGEISPEYTAAARRWRRMADDGRFEDMAQDMVGQFMAPPGNGVVRRRAAVARLMGQRFAGLTERELAMDITHHERLLAHPWSVSDPAITAPALVFTGEHDTITPPAVGRQVAQDLAALFTTVKEADHLVQIERDADLADLMARFFTDQQLDGLPYLNPVEHFVSV